jgi:hypothetical protein
MSRKFTKSQFNILYTEISLIAILYRMIYNFWPICQSVPKRNLYSTYSQQSIFGQTITKIISIVNIFKPNHYDWSILKRRIKSTFDPRSISGLPRRGDESSKPNKCSSLNFNISTLFQRRKTSTPTEVKYPGPPIINNLAYHRLVLQSGKTLYEETPMFRRKTSVHWKHHPQTKERFCMHTIHVHIFIMLKS